MAICDTIDDVVLTPINEEVGLFICNDRRCNYSYDVLGKNYCMLLFNQYCMLNKVLYN